MRLLIVERPRGLQDHTKYRIAFRAPTYAELYQRWAHARATASPGCGYLYSYIDSSFGDARYEVVDTFEEPGSIVRDKYWSYWVPGEPHVTPDDATTIRFKQMELE